jgi:hypothetical protein
MIYRIGQRPFRSRCLQAGSARAWFPDGRSCRNEYFIRAHIYA